MRRLPESSGRIIREAAAGTCVDGRKATKLPVAERAFLQLRQGADKFAARDLCRRIQSRFIRPTISSRGERLVKVTLNFFVSQNRRKHDSVRGMNEMQIPRCQVTLRMRDAPPGNARFAKYGPDDHARPVKADMFALDPAPEQAQDATQQGRREYGDGGRNAGGENGEGDRDQSVEHQFAHGPPRVDRRNRRPPVCAANVVLRAAFGAAVRHGQAVQVVVAGGAAEGPKLVHGSTRGAGSPE